MKFAKYANILCIPHKLPAINDDCVSLSSLGIPQDTYKKVLQRQYKIMKVINKMNKYDDIKL